MSGLWLELRMTVAFCIDSSSPGSPLLFHSSISDSELMKRRKAKSGRPSASRHLCREGGGRDGGR